MRRIVILGNAGSGKTTLARRIGEILAVPVIHLDLLFWEPGWREPEPETFRHRVSDAIATEGWVCEGNYARRTFDIRLPRADAVIWLDTPRRVCVRRVIQRSAFERRRPDLPTGCAERFDPQFLGFLRDIWPFDRSRRPDIEAERLAYGPDIPTTHLRGPKQIDAHLRTLASAAA